MATIQKKRIREKASASDGRRTLADRVIERLRQEIISGRLAPGTMIAEIPTAARLDVSRVPVREAMVVLEHDGLLIFEENGRCRVRLLTPRDFHEIYEVRLMLECEAFRLAALHHNDNEIDTLRDCIRQMARARSLDRVTLLDIDFHDRIIEASRQSRLSSLWKVMRSQIRLFTATLQREISGLSTNVRDVSIEAHEKCLEGIASRDPDVARQCAIEHLEPWSKWLKTTRPKGGEQ